MRNRYLQVRLAKDNTTPGETPSETINVDPEKLERLALVIGGIFVANKVVNTISEIAIHTAKVKIK